MSRPHHLAVALRPRVTPPLAACRRLHPRRPLCGVVVRVDAETAQAHRPLALHLYSRCPLELAQARRRSALRPSARRPVKSAGPRHRRQSRAPGPWRRARLHRCRGWTCRFLLRGPRRAADFGQTAGKAAWTRFGLIFDELGERKRPSKAKVYRNPFRAGGQLLRSQPLAQRKAVSIFHLS